MAGVHKALATLTVPTGPLSSTCSLCLDPIRSHVTSVLVSPWLLWAEVPSQTFLALGALDSLGLTRSRVGAPALGFPGVFLRTRQATALGTVPLPSGHPTPASGLVPGRDPSVPRAGSGLRMCWGCWELPLDGCGHTPVTDKVTLQATEPSSGSAGWAPPTASLPTVGTGTTSWLWPNSWARLPGRGCWTLDRAHLGPRTSEAAWPPPWQKQLQPRSPGHRFRRPWWAAAVLPLQAPPLAPGDPSPAPPAVPRR